MSPVEDVDLEALLHAPLTTVDGAATDLRRQLDAAPLVVVFVRHFGCLFCRERVAAIRQREGELRTAGARIVFVGPGTAAMARDFAAKHAGDSPVLGDPELGAFRAAGMRRSLGATLSWRLLRNGLRAWRAGHRQRGVQGDPWQQGGVLVLTARGAVLHRQVDRAAGDPLDLDAVVACVRTAAARPD